MVTSRTRSAATSDTLAHRSDATATNAASRSPFGVPSRAAHLATWSAAAHRSAAAWPRPRRRRSWVALRVPEAGGPEAGGRLDPGGPGVPTDRAQVPGDGRDRGPRPGTGIPRRRQRRQRGDAAPAPRPVQPFGEAPQLGSALAARGRREAAHQVGDGSGAPGGFVGSPECERGGAADGGGFGAVGYDRNGGVGAARGGLRFGGSTYILLNICG